MEETISLDLSQLTAENVPPLESAEDAPKTALDDDVAPEPQKRGLFSRFRRNGRQKDAKPVPAMPRGGIAAPMAALYTKVGTFIKPFDPGCGTALIMGANDCGKAWEEVCKRNPAVRRWVLALLSTGANMELLVAHLPILAAVAIHHIPAVRDMVTKMTGDMTAMFEATLKDMEHNANAA